MRTSGARPPYQVGCSCQTAKVLSLSRAPYTPIIIIIITIIKTIINKKQTDNSNS